MIEKYVRLNAIMDILHRLSLEAGDTWDMDGVVMCGKIREEIGKLPREDYYLADTQTKQDKL